MVLVLGLSGTCEGGVLRFVSPNERIPLLTTDLSRLGCTTSLPSDAVLVIDAVINAGSKARVTVETPSRSIRALDCLLSA